MTLIAITETTTTQGKNHFIHNVIGEFKEETKEKRIHRKKVFHREMVMTAKI